VSVQRALLLSREGARGDPAGPRGAEEEGTERAAAAPHSGQRGSEEENTERAAAVPHSGQRGSEAGPAPAGRSAGAAEELRARGGAVQGYADLMSYLRGTGLFSFEISTWKRRK